MKIRWIHVIIFAALVFYVGGTSLTIESAEQITGFENKDLPVLNEELKRIDSEMSVLVPKGIIALWYGAIDDIPQGWVICDGENDTPDLTDKFIIHADADSGGTNDVADTGGAHSVTLTGAQSGLPIHTHAIATYEGGGGGAAKRVDGTDSDTLYQSVNSSPSAAANAASSHENRPAYYALAYIMKS